MFNSPIIIYYLMKIIFGTEGDELTGGWRKLYNEVKAKLSV
jgi:hypothetical protein